MNQNVMRVYAKMLAGVSLISQSAWSSKSCKPHNVSAIIRTADAVGVHKSMLSGRWPDAYHGFRGGGRQQLILQVKTHRTIGDAVAHLKGRECRFWQPIFLIRP